MPAPLPLPVRILVKGASNVGIASGMGGSRTDFTFPRAIEAELLAQGRPAAVQAISVPSERAKSTLRNWEREMIGFSPDVVVLGHGHYETVHLFLPWWLERHANSRRAKPRRLSALYRKRLLRPTWMALARLQARLDRRIDPNIRRSRPARVVADTERLIERIRYLHSPLVFVLEFQPPSSRYRSWFPGMTARLQVMNRELAAMVERIGEPDVRYFPTSGIVSEIAGGDLESALPDGFHFTPEIHRAIGVGLAAQIGEWADTQGHLKQHG